MTASLLFYNKITPLNRDNHRELKLKIGTGKAEFAGKTHYVPLAAGEFYQAARDYPILFVGTGKAISPVALLGLRSEENLFLNADKSWAKGVYVPAFVRRYPFVLGNVQPDSEEFTVCIDAEYDGFSQAEGTALFDEAGKETPYLNDTITFLNQFMVEMKRTRQFAEKLEELDLLVTRNLRIDDGLGRHFYLQDFRAVDEGKLNQLSDAALVELYREGYIGWIYAHLISIGNVTRLPERVPGAVSPTVTDDQAQAPAKSKAKSKTQ